uniref:WAP domain-containing protein n=1 Tax=Gopherus agassizii TaxID=38772 RepID=A0A452HDY5_9SAUR
LTPTPVLIFHTCCLVALPIGPFSVAGMPRKRGTCPPNLMKCLYTEPPLCLNDTSCQGRQKCCYNMCRPLWCSLTPQTRDWRRS